MKSEGYETLTEWEKDMDFYREHPNDTQFLNYIVQKINKSPQTLRLEIEDIVQGDMMEKDPGRFFSLVARNKAPGKVLVINTRQDPWFRV